jgi:nitrogen fixation NifU-like protein
MSDLRDLYQEVILDHTKKPRNFHKMEAATNSAKGHNPLCGDRLTVYVKLENDIVQDISFEGSGCAISTASASMMTESLKGKTRSDVEATFHRFHELVAGKSESTKASGLWLAVPSAKFPGASMRDLVLAYPAGCAGEPGECRLH